MFDWLVREVRCDTPEACRLEVCNADPGMNLEVGESANRLPDENRELDVGPGLDLRVGVGAWIEQSGELT